jgi:hypothetical protein
MPAWLFVPGFALFMVGLVMGIGGAMAKAGLEWRFLAIRVRFVGMGLLFALPGAWMLVEALLDGTVLGILVSLLLIGMGSLWLGTALGMFSRYISFRRGPDPSTTGPWDHRQHEPTSKPVPPNRREP